jgi:hypothetical protein
MLRELTEVGCGNAGIDGFKEVSFIYDEAFDSWGARTTAWRVTVGKSSRNSPAVCPPSR